VRPRKLTMAEIREKVRAAVEYFESRPAVDARAERKPERLLESELRRGSTTWRIPR